MRHFLQLLVRGAALGLVVLPLACGRDARSTPQVAHSELYLVGTYDPKRAPERDTAEAVTRAKQAHKNVLLIAGGDWCSWCKTLEEYLDETPDIAKLAHERFVIVKVNVSDENMNEAFLARFPEPPGYPHFFVLDGSGTLLTSAPTSPLESLGSYDDDAFRQFLLKWGPQGR